MIMKSNCSSSIMASPVIHSPKYNPESIMNYYSCGMQGGRPKDSHDKNLIFKAKNHLSAVGWTFFYMFKQNGRQDLQYRSPTGRVYVSLRAACECALKDQDCFKNRDVGDIGSVGSPKIRVLKEPEKKRESFSSDDRPRKKIRVKEEGSLYVDLKIDNKDSSSFDVGKNEGVKSERPVKRIPDIKRLMGLGEKTIRKTRVSCSGKRCVLSSLIENDIVDRGSRVTYRRKKDGRCMAKGGVYEDGIKCDCCDDLFLLTKFEAHAGSTYHRPAANIFLDDGRSISDCQTELQFKNGLSDNVETKKSSDFATNCVTGNDEYCSFCYDGGELLLCDSCTSSYHATCIGLNSVPESNYWFCPACSCGLCYQSQKRNFTKEENHINLGQIKCRQCEHYFHTHCLAKLGFQVSPDDTKWLCSDKCERISCGLTGILGQAIPLMGGNLSWSLLKLDQNDMHEYTKTYSKLTVALDVMHECFRPIKHPWSNKDVVEDVIFSRSTKRLNLQGFFTAVLEREDEMITVVTLRIHGGKVAEIPLVATRFRYRKLGMCRILMDEVERKMRDLEVERIVLPAAQETVSTWTQSFGFSVMTDSERLDLINCKFLEFPGTIQCHKLLKEM